jgi:hypothetical protein
LAAVPVVLLGAVLLWLVEEAVPAEGAVVSGGFVVVAGVL